MRSDLALNFLLSMAVLFSAMVQAAPTNNIHPSPLIFAIQKVALTPSTSDFISKFSAVGFDRGVDKSHIVRVRSSDFGLDETVLSDLNLTDTEIRETKSCYTTCSLPISSDQSLRSDCQKAAQKSSLKGAACMCHHDGFIADIQGCHDRCFPKNHTFPPEMVASTRYAAIIAAEKKGASSSGCRSSLSPLPPPSL